MDINTARLGALQKQIINQIQRTEIGYVDILAIVLNKPERQITKACISLIGRGILLANEHGDLMLTKGYQKGGAA